ncbi:MAG TPA: hypothetical protein P5346_06245 [Spirochaetota bacterium]|nr:hypothetical protein [Spirochaetota bacterium]HSA14330.1 hypothetical protein [Spirochaetota bacterium]
MEKNLKPVVVLESLTAIGLILFWTGFFTIGLAPESPPPGYFEYEHSFPLPDLILAAALLAAAWMLRRGKPAGRTLSLVCAGALIFLGVLDFSFNIQNGMYAISAMDLVLNAFINAWCVLLGIWIALRLRQR